MEPKQAFDVALARAEHFLTLYDLLHDTRARRVRRDWADRFKEVMHWPVRENIVRIDGKDRKSILILREELGIDRSRFTHEVLSELLRSALVAAVSALDRYLHDLVVEHCWKLLSRKEEDIPTELRKLQLPVVATKKALKRLRADPNSRPGYVVKRAVQEHLHRHFTFQKPESVLSACQMLGVEDFWARAASEMPGSPDKQDVIFTLKDIALRRNQIVHEADLILKIKPKTITTRSIGATDTREQIEWIRNFVAAIDTIVREAI
jgi:hypothetical protein